MSISLMCAGVVLQHPPMTRAPEMYHSFAILPKCRAPPSPRHPVPGTHFFSSVSHSSPLLGYATSTIWSSGSTRRASLKVRRTPGTWLGAMQFTPIPTTGQGWNCPATVACLLASWDTSFAKSCTSSPLVGRSRGGGWACGRFQRVEKVTGTGFIYHAYKPRSCSRFSIDTITRQSLTSISVSHSIRALPRRSCFPFHNMHLTSATLIVQG